MPRQTKEDRAIEFARINEVDQIAFVLMRQRDCSLAEAWRRVLDGERPRNG